MSWSFGLDIYDKYTFPRMDTWRDNFGDILPRTKRMLGLSGGFDIYGREAAPNAIGQVQAGFTITSEWANAQYAGATDRDSMEAARDAVKAMASWGVGRLIKPDGPSASRWCYARINNISMSENPASMDHLWQPVRISWQVADPKWYGADDAYVWGQGDWNDGKWGRLETSQACSGSSTFFPVAYNGNGPALATVWVEATSFCSTVKVRRLYRSVTVDSLTYSAGLTNGQVLKVDSRAKRAHIGGTDAFNSNFVYTTPEWFALEPGSNTISVELGSGSATVYITYWEAYR